MALLDFFTSNEPIAGLEINDAAVRIVLLKKEKKTAVEPKNIALKVKDVIKKAAGPVFETKLVAFFEEELDPGVVVEGEIKEPDKLRSVLSRMAQKIKNSARFVVLTIPSDGVYSHFQIFPTTVEPEKIDDTLRLSMEYQLPVSSQINYSDWQKMISDKENSAIMASASRAKIDKYSSVLLHSGFNAVAIEYSLLSIARILGKKFIDHPVAVVLFGRESFTVGVVENGQPRLVRAVPLKQSDNNSWSEEMRKVIEFYEAEYQKKVLSLVKVGEEMGSSKLSIPEFDPAGFSEVSDLNIPSENGRFLVSLGAAERGVLKRSEDKMLSLMGVRTEEAYETKKALAFASLVSSLIISLSAFMVAIYGGLWLMTVSLQRNVNEQLKVLSSIPTPVGGAELESRAVKLNATIASDAALIRTMPRFSLVLEGLRNLLPSGIKLQTISIPEIAGTITISGVASDRTQLRIFKRALDESNFFGEVVLPITNISLSKDIPFSMTMRLVDPNSTNYR